MKAPAFDYVKPRLLAEIFPLLQQFGDEARLLAGGQTLLATLNMRLSEPSVLIDLSAIRSGEPDDVALLVLAMLAALLLFPLIWLLLLI